MLAIPSPGRPPVMPDAYIPTSTDSRHASLKELRCDSPCTPHPRICFVGCCIGGGVSCALLAIGVPIKPGQVPARSQALARPCKCSRVEASLVHDPRQSRAAVARRLAGGKLLI